MPDLSPKKGVRDNVPGLELGVDGVEIKDVKQEQSRLGDNGLDNPFIPKEAITPAVRRVQKGEEQEKQEGRTSVNGKRIL